MDRQENWQSWNLHRYFQNILTIMNIELQMRIFKDYTDNIIDYDLKCKTQKVDPLIKN